MTPLDERARLLELFDEAVAGGAARYKVAELMGVSERTLKRWRDTDGRVAQNRRPEAEPVEQPHRLSQVEEVAILSACNQPEYRSLPPSRSCRRWLAKAFTSPRSHRSTGC
ncbi:helix-turn-helix domain-containing protein [Marinobacter sp.]|uniref:helix-turn-helix domain-containing protein n=1 Tax=Marinobacter sp. TaxID=50741 RepID=UPI001B4D82F3|nr:helix-turn-helix domain-containing protein [Marinobacter sp.]